MATPCLNDCSERIGTAARSNDQTRRAGRALRLCPLILAAGLTCGCSHRPDLGNAPDVAPTTQPADAARLELDASQLKPLYLELMAIDLPTALRTAAAGNVDIRTARQQVLVSRGRFESAVGGAFPVLVPSAAFEHVEGTVRAVRGDLVGAVFGTFQPAIAAQWVLNPPQIFYDIVASRKRLYAAEQQEASVKIEALRQTAIQYYDLVLAQNRVSVAHEALREAEELLRINTLRSQTGTGVRADELRAEARVAERQQDLVSALHGFYEASVALAVTLHLDAAVTLIPRQDHLDAVTLVRGELSLDELLDLAVTCRPDLVSVRMLVDAANAARRATWWGAFGPQFQLSYQYSGITGHSENTAPNRPLSNNLIVNPASPTGAFSTNPGLNGAIRESISRASAASAGSRDQSFGISDQQRAGASAGWRFSLSAFGDLRASRASQEQAIVEMDRRLDQVRAQVVIARQASLTNHELMLLAHRQLAASAETLRLSQANLSAGTMTTLDVLQAQDAANQARLRHAEAVVRYNQSQANLLASLGALTLEALTK